MEKSVYKNNCKACYDGYNKGLTVEWMASMSGVSKSTIYKQINQYKKQLSQRRIKHKENGTI